MGLFCFGRGYGLSNPVRPTQQRSCQLAGSPLGAHPTVAAA